MNGFTHLQLRLHAIPVSGIAPGDEPVMAYTDATFSGHLAARSAQLPEGALCWVHLILHQPSSLFMATTLPAHVICLGLRGEISSGDLQIKAGYALAQTLAPGLIAEVPAGEYEFCCWATGDQLIPDREVPLLPENIQQLENIRRLPWNATGIAALNSMATVLLNSLKSTDRTPDGIRTTLSFIRDNYADPISVKRLSRMAGLNVNAYTIRFREATGLAPSAFIQRIRIEAGRKLMQNRSLTLDEISARSGFTSRHYFSKVFRRHYGLSPAEYRRNSGKSEKLHIKS